MSTFVNTVDVVGDEALTNSILDRSITELDDNMVLNLCDNALRGCKSLTRLRMMSVTEIGEYACGYCEALKEIDFPLATAVVGYAFTNCLALEEVAFPAVETITGYYTFNNCHALKLVDLGAITTLGTGTFYGCSALVTLILRTESVCSVSSISNVFYNTPISKGTGYIYVPAALVDSYKTAGGWSTYANQIRAIEDYPEICDPYSWEAVAKAIETGTYKDVYKIGDEVPVDLGSEGVINMQIAAFDADTLADGSGKAAISWVAKELLATSKRINPTRTGSSGAYTEGTGAIGGWEKCELRAYLQNTIKPLIPAGVSSMIQSVAKTQKAYDSAGESFTQTTTDDVWIPDKAEVYTSGGIYTGLFQDNTAGIKYKSGETSATDWHLRSAFAAWRFDYLTADGGVSSTNTSSAAARIRGVCLGFCTGVTPAAVS